LRAIGRSRRFARDQEIYGDGENADHIYKVAVGVVRTYKFLRDGRRHVDAFYGEGSVFGLELGSRYSLSAAAAGDCTVICYRRGSLESFASHQERTSLHLLASALKSLARAQEHCLSLGCRTAVEKLAVFLLAGADAGGAGASNEVVLGMTRKDIADHLGLTIETVSRTFAELERRALIELHGARLVRLVKKSDLQGLCL
jgi:CRP/FNR family nitrogen fixation transcriptional regulator